MAAYQTLRVAGKDIAPGERACEERYALLTPVLDQFERPITVLDLGANIGYFSTRIAEDYAAVCVAIDRDPELRTALAANNRPDVLGIVKQLSVQDILDIGKCEHFDVVLAMNVLHHFADPAAALAAVRTLGDHILIETPLASDTGACGTARGKDAILAGLEDLKGAARIVGWTDSHTTPGSCRPVYHLRESKTKLDAPYFRSYEQSMPAMRPNSIISNHLTKSLVIPSKNELRPWLPGINLWTFIKLGGGYPNAETLVSAVEHAYFQGREEMGQDHGDVRPWNFILSGPSTATLIDWNDERTLPTDDAEWLDITAAIIENPANMSKMADAA